MIRVNLTGVGVLPFPVASDKAFQLRLAPLLQERGFDVRFLSLSETPPGKPEGDLAFTYLPRFGHRDDARYYTVAEDGQAIGYHHVHGAGRQTAELAMTMLRHRGEFRSEGGPVVYHWMDISTALPALRAAVGRDAGIVASAQHWVPRGTVNDRARAVGYSSADVVLTGTAAAARMVRAAGCRAPLVAVVPWTTSRAPARPEVEPPAGPLRLLWTGPIRQIGFDDFLVTHAMAEQVVAANPDVEFTFCFKPQFYRDELLEYERERVRVIPGDSSFLDTLGDYDAMLSPTIHSRTTMAPPLAWVEALSAGLPILTTPTVGIEELVADGRWGMVAADADELATRLSDPAASGRIRAMRAAAIAEFEARYAPEVVADEMAAIIRWIAEGRSAGEPAPMPEAGR